MSLIRANQPTNIHSVYAWLQSVGWENMAFVFLNRYLDLSEVCNDDTVVIGNELHHNLICFTDFISYCIITVTQ